MRELESNCSPRHIAFGGYLEADLWVFFDVLPVSDGPAERVAVIRRLTGEIPAEGDEPDSLWDQVEGGFWDAGISSDGKWNLCFANGSLERPYLVVDNVTTSLSHRKKGLAKRLLNRIGALLRLTPVPELVKDDAESPGLAQAFWTRYLGSDISQIIETRYARDWRNFLEHIREFAKNDPSRHDLILSWNNRRNEAGSEREP